MRKAPQNKKHFRAQHSCFLRRSERERPLRKLGVFRQGLRRCTCRSQRAICNCGYFTNSQSDESPALCSATQIGISGLEILKSRVPITYLESSKVECLAFRAFHKINKLRVFNSARIKNPNHLRATESWMALPPIRRLVSQPCPFQFGLGRIPRCGSPASLSHSERHRRPCPEPGEGYQGTDYPCRQADKIFRL